jgi:hypothetical protein
MPLNGGAHDTTGDCAFPLSPILSELNHRTNRIGPSRPVFPRTAESRPCVSVHPPPKRFIPPFLRFVATLLHPAGNPANFGAVFITEEESGHENFTGGGTCRAVVEFSLVGPDGR